MTSDRLAYSYAEVAAMCGVSRTTICRAVAAGDLPVHYLGQGRTKPRIYRDDVVAWVKGAPSDRASA